MTEPTTKEMLIWPVGFIGISQNTQKRSDSRDNRSSTRSQRESHEASVMSNHPEMMIFDDSVTFF